MTYLMETPQEGERLLVKSNSETTKEQLILTGLNPGMTCLDAGGGAGFVTSIMADIVQKDGLAILVDQSEQRLNDARSHNSSHSNVQYIQTELEKIPLESTTIDYVFCRFVFEYLSNPEKVFDELLRICKPGGKLVVGDLDHNIMNHYPLTQRLYMGLMEISTALQNIGLWDPYSGRKIYSYFHSRKLIQTKVHMIPHHLIYGEASEADLMNMDMKLKRIEDMQSQKQIELPFEMADYRKEFMTFFRDPGRFTYTPLILVEGVKP